MNCKVCNAEVKVVQAAVDAIVPLSGATQLLTQRRLERIEWCPKCGQLNVDNVVTDPTGKRKSRAVVKKMPIDNNFQSVLQREAREDNMKASAPEEAKCDE